MWYSKLNVLHEVVQRGTMAAAARALRIDRATVGRQLRELEDGAPAVLFQRSARGIRLTPYGARALEAHREHEAARARLEQALAVREFDRPVPVTLTAPNFVASELLVPALAAFSRAYPDISVNLVATTRPLDIAAGEADVGVRNLRPEDPALAYRKVGRLGLSMYASREYLERRGGLREPRDLTGHDIIVYDSGPYVGPGFEWWGEAARACRVAFAANDPKALCGAACAGLGIATLPHLIAEPQPELVRLPGGSTGSADVLIVTRARETRALPVRPVAQLVATLVKRHQAELYQPRTAAECSDRSSR